MNEVTRDPMSFFLLAMLGALPTVLEAMLHLVWAADRTDPAILAAAGTATIVTSITFVVRGSRQETTPIALGVVCGAICLFFAAYALWLGPDSVGAWLAGRGTPSIWRILIHLVSGGLTLANTSLLAWVTFMAVRMEAAEKERGASGGSAPPR